MPYLVCDKPAESEQVEYYTIVGLPGDPRADLYTGPEPYGMKYDLIDTPPGVYNLQVSACNAWQCSLPAPFDFTIPGKPSVPTGLGVLFA